MKKFISIIAIFTAAFCVSSYGNGVKKMHLRIRHYNESVLRHKGEFIREFGSDLKKLTDDMIETMYLDEAYGLAAQQVGHALQVFVVDVLEIAKKEGDSMYITLDGKQTTLDLIMPLVVINPELIPVFCKELSYEEDCMSFPGGIYLPIVRPEYVHLKYQDLQGISHELHCGGMLARCILHEFDHLQGILFIDRASQCDLMLVESKIKQLESAI